MPHHCMLEHKAAALCRLTVSHVTLLQSPLVLIEINILLQDAAGAQGGLEETLSDLRRLISDDFVSHYRGLGGEAFGSVSVSVITAVIWLSFSQQTCFLPCVLV